MLINLTPHPIDLYPYGTTYEDLKGNLNAVQHVTLWPSRTIQPVRLPEVIAPKEDICINRVRAQDDDFCVPVVQVKYKIPNLPKQTPGVYYIVPRLVADMLKRNDFVYPYELLRDEAHKVIGCTRLGRFT